MDRTQAGIPVDDELVATFAASMIRAGSVLAAMSGRPIRISTPSVRRCLPGEIVAMAGGAEAVVVAVYLGMFGGLAGHALLVLEPDCARRLAGLLLDGLGVEAVEGATDGNALGAIERSALGEIGNVVVSAFLNELGHRAPRAIQPTPPQVIVEMAGAVVDAVVLDVLGNSDRVLAGHTVFHDGEDLIQALLLILPQVDSLEALVAGRARRTA